MLITLCVVLIGMRRDMCFLSIISSETWPIAERKDWIFYLMMIKSIFRRTNLTQARDANFTKKETKIQNLRLTICLGQSLRSSINILQL